MTPPSRCRFRQPLGDFGDGRTAGASKGLYLAIALSGTKHIGNASVALGVLCPARVRVSRLCLLDTFGLATTTVLIVLAGDTATPEKQAFFAISLG